MENAEDLMTYNDLCQLTGLPKSVLMIISNYSSTEEKINYEITYILVRKFLKYSVETTYFKDLERDIWMMTQWKFNGQYHKDDGYALIKPYRKNIVLIAFRHGVYYDTVIKPRSFFSPKGFNALTMCL